MYLYCSDENYIAHISVCRFVVSEAGKADTQQLFNSRLTVGPYRPAVTLRGDLVLLVYELEMEAIMLAAINFNTKQECIVTTSLAFDVSGCWRVETGSFTQLSCLFYSVGPTSGNPCIQRERCCPMRNRAP